MSDRPTPDRKANVLLLLAIAGCVDAVGLGETGRFFVSFMSGNTTALGQLVAYRDAAGALIPLGLAALFVGGATLGTLLAEAAGRRALAALLLAEAVLLLLGWAGLSSARPALGVVALPVAMGLANIVALRGPGPHVGATYTTGTLVRLGEALAGLGRGPRGADAPFLLGCWLALLLGSAAGALGRLHHGAAVLLVPAAALALLAVAALADGRRRA